MGRLIDADALIEVLKAEKKQDRSRAYGEHECDLIAGTIAMCIDTVKTIPTAYDIENVVAEIEIDRQVDFNYHIRTDYRLLINDIYDKTVQKVKKGGVE